MRRLRVWLIATTAATSMSSAVVATGQPVHEIQIAAARYAFDPATITVTAGEAVRLVIRSTDVVHGFAIPSLKIETRGAEAAKSRSSPNRMQPSASRACMRRTAVSTA
jgi:plastocyanin